MNIFERASRNKLRIRSDRGDVSTEQLWDIPLISNDTFSLDSIAQKVNAELQSVSTSSFVETKPNPRKRSLKLQLDILKHIIDAKQKQAADALQAAERAERRRKLISALSNKEDQELGEKSKDEILAELEELEDA